MTIEEMQISPRDEMFAGNYDHYFSVGRSAIDEISKAWRIADKTGEPSRILDLPSGHGRVMRTIRSTFPSAELTACDTNADGVAFCADEFKAIPVVGCADISATALNGKYDLIWCGSLLTHLDEERITACLKLFSDHLAGGGVVVLTTHGRKAVERGTSGVARYFADDRIFHRMVGSYWQTGFAYHPYPNADYGISLSSPAWIVRKLESFPELRLLMCHESGWDGHQDVFGCQRG